IRPSGEKAGPATGFAPRAGSNSAPWHGHTRRRAPWSHPTMQPACVHTLLNAATVSFPSRSRTAGSPFGAVNATAPPTGMPASEAMGVPEDEPEDEPDEEPWA